MTYEFAVTEATRRARVLTKSYAIVYAEYALATPSESRYMVIPLQDAESRDLLIVERIEIDVQTALQHEEILAGLANERPHSRFVDSHGNRVQWTYAGDGSMVHSLIMPIMEHLSDPYFKAKAPRYKTAQVATDCSDTFRKGEFVSVEFLRQNKQNLMFRCMRGTRIEVMSQYDLTRFVL